MGVAASHLDWTMVPYVKKSFYKHFVDGAHYIEEKDVTDIFKPDMSIEDEKYKNFSERAYKYALEETQKEIKQAVEGMFHNLKCLGSAV